MVTPKRRGPKFPSNVILVKIETNVFPQAYRELIHYIMANINIHFYKTNLFIQHSKLMLI